ncbi:MAG TPA: hypothetical protein P5241_03145 [Candidatus Paceibacterota bacterium]|jgi:tRNA nucleotidyltransferase/poly(A) polymerase|nr:hypothetical protein [Candidatus Paceibacterota bacterium]
MNFKIPTIIIKIVQEIKQQGFECYLVGGCVRDLLLEAKPND